MKERRELTRLTFHTPVQWGRIAQLSEGCLRSAHRCRYSSTLLASRVTDLPPRIMLTTGRLMGCTYTAGGG